MKGSLKMINCQRKSEKEESNSYHVKLPPGDSPYVRAKHVQMNNLMPLTLKWGVILVLAIHLLFQFWKPIAPDKAKRHKIKQLTPRRLVEKDPDAAIVLFWKAINAGDRVDSALKDMAVVMKQQDRAEEAIEAINSFRHYCSKQAQESLDNVLIDLYKKCGKLEEQIELLKQKLRMIYQGEAFNGKPTKTARSHGRKFQVTVKQETCRILGNLGWAYMQQKNYSAAEVVYRKAQQIDPDANKACNLCLCLINHARYAEARSVLEDVLQGKILGSDDPKSRNRAKELMKELEPSQYAVSSSSSSGRLSFEDAFVEGLDQLMNQWTLVRSRRLPIFEEITPYRDQLAS